MFLYSLTGTDERVEKDVFTVQVSGTYGDGELAIKRTTFNSDEFTSDVMELIYMIDLAKSEMIKKISGTNNVLRDMLPKPMYGEIENYVLDYVICVDIEGNEYAVLIKPDVT